MFTRVETAYLLFLSCSVVAARLLAYVPPCIHPYVLPPRDEDHTLGNALRHVLMENKEVDFCGYSVPHPSEPKMNLRLQTTGKLHLLPVLLLLRLNSYPVRLWR